MNTKIILYSFFLLFFSTTNYLVSQNKEDVDFIQKQSNLTELNRLKNKFNKKYKKTILEAKSLGFNLNAKGVIKGTLNSIIDGVPFYDFDDNVNSAITNRVNKIWNGGSSGLNLTGSSIIIGHWEASGLPRSTHVELSGKIVLLEATGTSAHATHTAGTMVATGVNASARGMATNAIVHARKSNNDESEMASFAAGGGLVSNHSYGSSNPNGNILFYGYYSSHAQDWDEISYNAPYYLICKSAGNERNNGYNGGDGGYDILFTQATAKNILVIGAIDDVANYTGPSSVSQTDFSSYGPTDDWRIKPDIMANGSNVFSTDSGNDTDYKSRSGTSMAAPSVTGTVALLQEHYHNINNVYMKSATVKATLINSADELGNNPGPDFANGWGLVNAEAAANIITNNKTTSIMLEESLANNQTYEFTVNVDGTKPLSLTMVWTDVAATPLNNQSVDQSTLRLINDLDVRVIGNGNTYVPWIIETGSFSNPATKGDNFRDNVEKIEVDNIPAGTYTVKVTHKGQLFNAVDQGFSIAVNNITSSSLSTNQFLADNFEIYPNPVNNNEINISLKQSISSGVEVLLSDLTGRQIKKELFNTTSKKILFKTPPTLSGLYLLTIKSEKSSLTKKIIIN